MNTTTRMRYGVYGVSSRPLLPLRLRRLAMADLKVGTTYEQAVGTTSEDVSPIEPIETGPIALSALDVPQLHVESTAIESITIAPIPIEPLAASND